MTGVFYLLKVVLCSCVLFLYYWLALRNKRFHQWNRFYLLLAIPFSIALPFVQFNWFLQSEVQNNAIRFVKTVQTADEILEAFVVVKHPSPSPERWLPVIYGSVCVVFLLLFLFSLLKIISLIRSHKVEPVGKVKFVNTAVPGTPFSFFDYIFWNQNIPLHTETGLQIFEHEMVHVQEKHTLDKLFLQAVLVVFWCNPFFWLMRKELRFVHEFIADRKAAAQHGTAALAAMILQAAYPQQFHLLTNHFFQTPVKRRLAMLTKTQNPKLSYASRLIALPLIALTALAFSSRVKPISNYVSKSKDFVVVIDAGHGMTNGNYSGARANDQYEDELVLSLAKKILEGNANDKIRIVLTRQDGNVVDLKNRVATAQSEKADLFISLHMNAVTPGSESDNKIENRSGGVEVYVPGQPTAYQQQSSLFGSALVQQLAAVYSTHPTLLQTKSGVWVLDHNVCPSVLIECGYITNEKDRLFFTVPENQNLLAQKVLAAINQYASAIEQNTGMVLPNPNTGPEEKNTSAATRSGNAAAYLIDKSTPGSGNAQIGDTSKPILPKPLYLVDGKEFNGDLKAIESNTMAEINVLKDAAAIAKYGEKGKYGVVEIILKKTKEPYVPRTDDNIIFNKLLDSPVVGRASVG